MKSLMKRLLPVVFLIAAAAVALPQAGWSAPCPDVPRQNEPCGVQVDACEKYDCRQHKGAKCGKGCRSEEGGRHGRRPFGEKAGPSLERMTRHLKLSSGQQTQVAAILERERAARTPLEQELAKNHSELKALQAARPHDAAKVRQLVIRQGEVRTQLQLLRLQSHDEVQALLTPEQQAQSGAQGKGDGNTPRRRCRA